MHWIDQIQINFEGDKMLLMNICLAFVMFGIALDMSLKDFRRVFEFPRAVAVGLSSQLILLPLLTFVLVLIWQPHISIALGLILIAACPGGNISNFAVHLARGNTALSVSLTSIVTLGAVILTPTNFHLWAGWYPEADSLLKNINLDFWRLASIVVKLILIPLFLGMGFAAWQPDITLRIQKPIRLLSLVIFAAFIVFALMANIENISQYLHLVLWIVIIHNLLALAAGYWYARAWGLEEKDRRAISMETGIQNGGLGLILIFNFFGGLGGMALAAAWWGIWDIFSSLALAWWWKRRGVA